MLDDGSTYVQTFQFMRNIQEMENFEEIELVVHAHRKPANGHIPNTTGPRAVR